MLNEIKLEIESVLDQLLNHRKDRLDRYDATYLEDFHHIMRENYQIEDINDKSHENFNHLKQIYPPNSSITLQQYTQQLLSIVDKNLFKPQHTTKEDKKRFKYDQTPSWNNTKDVTTDVEKIKLVQKEYSLQSKGKIQDHPNFWNGNGFAEKKEGVLDDYVRGTNGLDLLAVGPRYLSEVKFLRDRFKTKAVGLDLFSYDENLIKIGDMNNMPFGDNSFDIIYEKNTFNKSYDMRRTFDECIRVLRPGGLLIYEECMDYTTGVNEIARSNITTHEWSKAYLRDNIQEVLVAELKDSPEFWKKYNGLFAVIIKK